MAKSKAELAGHLNHAHKEGDAVRWRIGATICPCCNTEFESRERIIRHLQCNGSLLCRVFVFENCSPLSFEEYTILEQNSRNYQASLRKQGKDRHFCNVKPYIVNGPLHPKSYFHLSRSERIAMLRDVAANINGKSYESKTGCGWKVGGGDNRRVRCGTGGGSVGSGFLVLDDTIQSSSDNGQAPPQDITVSPVLPAESNDQT